MPWYVLTFTQKYYDHNVTGSILTTNGTTAIKTNNWVGKGNNNNWNNAKNWSLGTPVNGQNLDIDLGLIKSSGGIVPSVKTNDNIKNLVVNELIFSDPKVYNGQKDTVIITGDTITITKAVEDTINNSIGGPDIENNFILKGSVAIDATSANPINFDNNTVTLANNAKVLLTTVEGNLGSSLNFSTLSGNGSIVVSPGADIGFSDSSPNLSGSVTINNGAVVNLSNYTYNIGGPDNTATTPDGLGSSYITIKSGGNVEILVLGDGHSDITIANNMSIGGNGSMYPGRNASGYMTGAVNACIANGQVGCIGYLQGQGSPSVVTFTGSVTLLGNTQLGAVTEESQSLWQQGDISYTDYNFTKPLINPHSYTLSPVYGSMAQINTSN